MSRRLILVALKGSDSPDTHPKFHVAKTTQSAFRIRIQCISKFSSNNVVFDANIQQRGLLRRSRLAFLVVVVVEEA